MTSYQKKFHLRIYDNFHYMDESEAYNYGEFESYEEARRKAKSIVDEFFIENWKTGVNPVDLLSQYVFYGEEPVILPNEPGENETFSARIYAEISAEKICQSLEKIK